MNYLELFWVKLKWLHTLKRKNTRDWECPRFFYVNNSDLQSWRFQGKDVLRLTQRWGLICRQMEKGRTTGCHTAEKPSWCYCLQPIICHTESGHRVVVNRGASECWTGSLRTCLITIELHCLSAKTQRTRIRLIRLRLWERELNVTNTLS